MNIVMRSTAALIPYERNPRKNDAAVEAVAKSISQFGFRNPILLDKDGVVVAGHTRLKAAQLLKIADVPCIIIDDLTPEQLKALRIVDNSTAQIAQWDFELLSMELSELPEFNFEDFGLDLDEMKEALLDTSAADDAIPQNEAAEALLNTVWRDWRSDCVTALKALEATRTVSVGLSRNAARIYFLNALYYKKRFPRFATVAYHPHKIAVAGDKYSLLDYFVGVKEFKDERIRFALAENPAWEKAVKGSLPIAGCRQPLDFPADLAQSLIDELCVAGGSVLDPCHGWGGRAVGFMLSSAKTYTGFDPSPETAAGVRDLIDDLQPYVKEKTLKTHEQCFEDAKLKAASFDFALTSPPYYDVEKYTGDNSSHARYKNFETWNTQFYRVMIRNVAAALKAGAFFALQVGNQKYPLEKHAIVHAASCGLSYVETRATGMVNNQADTAEDDGEVTVVFRKASA